MFSLMGKAVDCADGLSSASEVISCRGAIGSIAQVNDLLRRESRSMSMRPSSVLDISVGGVQGRRGAVLPRTMRSVV